MKSSLQGGATSSAALLLLTSLLLCQIGSAGLLTVMQPSSLAEVTKELEASLGNFGHINYGQTIMGQVIYPSRANTDGCQPLREEHFGPKHRGTMALFVLVERGGCPNPTKVRNIENYGASVALIADYKPESVEEIVMVDYGGAGHSLVTPGFLIDFYSSLEIKMALEAGADVVMRAALTIAKPDNEVEIGLLYSSSLDLDSSSMEAFTTLALESARTRQKALLDLHIHTFACPFCPAQLREENCLANGTYCAFFPKVGDISQSMLDPEDYGEMQTNVEGAMADFTGRELLISSLYEKCYHQELKRIIGNSKADSYDLEMRFINKMIIRLRKCEQQFAQTGNFNMQCIFTKEAIPDPLQNKVEACFQGSFETQGDFESNNLILQADSQWAKEHHLDFHPTITINDFTYRGDIDFADIREAICAAYNERPTHCNLEEIWSTVETQMPYEAGEGKIEHQEDGRKERHKLSIYVVMAILFCIFVIQFFIWLYLQRKTRHQTNDEMSQRVSAALHEYIALSPHDESFSGN